MIVQHVGAPPYCHTEVCAYLDLILHGRRTGGADRIPCPSTFSSDFSVCGFVRYVVHFHNPSSLQWSAATNHRGGKQGGLYFGEVQSSHKQRLPKFGRSNRVSNCTPLDGMFIPPWYTKIKYLESRVCRVSFVPRVFLLPDRRPWTLGFHNMIFLEPVSV